MGLETVFEMKRRHQREWNDLILAALRASDGNRTLAARMIGIDRAQFSRRINRYDLDAPPASYGRPKMRARKRAK